MDIELSFSQSGTGDTLVLLHGNGEDRGYFSAQIEPFSKHFRVISVDTRGHGLSPRGQKPFTLIQFAEDLLALLNRLNIPRADLLGFSDGGNIALLFALRYPQRMGRLIVNGANLYPSGMQYSAWLSIDRQYAHDCLAALFGGGNAHRKELLGLMATQPHIRAKDLHALTMPVLVIAGTHDLIRERHTRLIAKSLPNAELVLLEGGHCIAQEQPEAFNQCMLSFLERHPL